MWDVRNGRRYYYRSVRVGNRVVHQYVGTGPLAELAATADALRRAQRRAEAEARQRERARLEAAEGPLLELNGVADLVTRAALTAAGFHQHERGEWRRKRR
jgi:hypothetical protein